MRMISGYGLSPSLSGLGLTPLVMMGPVLPSALPTKDLLEAQRQQDQKDILNAMALPAAMFLGFGLLAFVLVKLGSKR